ncbi:FAD:protein FMN transferase [Prevotella sp. 10(H)]|uniref:FAD:protein FMN transferase n=1 Tax=Prevotella sp. 10(H) TaxID=1158294 RepID=UPI001E31A8F3|nr:FAD:protein FMN transferase [Prevotella sp. 10(H)]
MYFEEKGEIFHTTYSIKYLYTQSLKAEIEDKFLQYDNSLNAFKPTSIISKINKNEEAVPDSFFINVFKRSQEVSLNSEGLFDITISPLINAWGFGFKNMDNVTPQIIDSLRLLVGYDKIRLENGEVKKSDPRIQFNMSAIAKGYATDVIAELLESYGISNYMVEIGGEIRTKGNSPKGNCWNIGITKPIGKNIYDYQNLQTILRLCNKSLATSGNFRNYYIKDGRKYAHTINPKTGYPSESNILSTTIIADDCMTADAYATAFMLMDTTLTRKVAEKEKLEYMLVLGEKDSTFTVVKSKNFDEYIVY